MTDAKKLAERLENDLFRAGEHGLIPPYTFSTSEVVLIIAALRSAGDGAWQPPEWARRDVLPLGDEIDRLIDAMFGDPKAEAELRILLWENKVGICRLLQELAAPAPSPVVTEEEIARLIFDKAVGLRQWDNEFYSEERAGCLDTARAVLALLNSRPSGE